MDYLDYEVYIDMEEEVDIPRMRVLRERRDPFAMYSDSDFRERFGFRKESFESLLGMLEPLLHHSSDRNRALSPRLQLLCALRIFRTGTYQIVAGDLINIHRTTAGRAFHSVINSLIALKPLYVSMPQSQENISRNKREFYRIGGFPNVIGAIDCVHIPILCPSGEQAELYRNRKNFFSINTQIICDANMKIMNVVSRWPGSTHDARIWDNSRVAAEFENGQYDGLLVGDSGYALSKHLMTPVFRPQTGAEGRYNRAHIATRCVIERTFGVWKKRFQLLTKTMRYKPNKCGNVIVAAAVLHNFGIEVGDVFYPDAVEVNDIDQYAFQPEANAAGQAVRRSIILNYFN